MAQAPVTTSIQDEFYERFAGSRERHERARTLIPGGITHDGRHLRPFPVYVTRAEGAHKWDVDGHELVDYAMGHGSLILGHNHPQIVAAVQDQLTRGTHFGAGHDGEIGWADRIRKLMPSAEQVKFTSSGTESTMLAVRLARAATGRTTIVKLAGHFHGWNDYLLKGEKPPFGDEHVVGVPDEVLSTVDVLPADIERIKQRLSSKDVAAVILEPSGGSWAKVPLPNDSFLPELRKATSETGTLLIFDEVITGFRWSPGGAQARYGVVPDLTTLAKIVAGGLPGGAVAGRLEVMQQLAFKDDPAWNAKHKVRHPGTYNANPLSAAAGSTCLDLIKDGRVHEHVDRLAKRLRTELNQVLRESGAPGFVWGEASVFHIALGVTCENASEEDLRRPQGVSPEALKANGKPALTGPLAQGMLLEGVDLFNNGGLVSAAHTDADVDRTVEAFRRTIRRLAAEGKFDS